MGGFGSADPAPLRSEAAHLNARKAGNVKKLYAQIDTDFFENAKVEDVSPLARLEFVACLIVAKRHYETDGVVTARWLKRQQPDIEHHDSLLAELVEAELIVPCGDDRYQIPGWTNWNDSAAQIEARQQRMVDMGRRGGKTKAQQQPQAASSSDTLSPQLSDTLSPQLSDTLKRHAKRGSLPQRQREDREKTETETQKRREEAEAREHLEHLGLDAWFDTTATDVVGSPMAPGGAEPTVAHGIGSADGIGIDGSLKGLSQTSEREDPAAAREGTDRASDTYERLYGRDSLSQTFAARLDKLRAQRDAHYAPGAKIREHVEAGVDEWGHECACDDCETWQWFRDGIAELETVLAKGQVFDERTKS